MELECEEIVGQTPDFKPMYCGEPAIEMSGVKKCIKHWNTSRQRINRRSKDPKLRE